MNYVITGSLGHTGKPITEGLVKAGHAVTVITSKAGNAPAIEALGATPAVGSAEDVNFLKQTFADADAVYLLIPPPKPDVASWRGFQNQVMDNYVDAIRANDVRFAVLLSTVGAHLSEGAGPVNGLHDGEEKLAQVEGLNAKFLRPAYFMYNFYAMIGMIKGMGIIGSSFGDDPTALAHTDDVAEAALEELLNLDFTGHSVRYIVSDERTGTEVAKVLGEAIGKPEIPWVILSDEQTKGGLMQTGMSEEIAMQYVKFGQALRNGTMQADYVVNKPPFGKVKLEQFARNEFAPAFNS